MNRWLRVFVPRPAASLRLVCFPHATGSAVAFRDWAAGLPDTIEVVAVQYPGRADRFREPAYTNMPQLVEAVADALSDVAGHPYALLGHGMGAAIAYETALRLRERNHCEPVRLIVSAREAPQHSHTGTIHLSGEEVLIAELHRFGFTNPTLLRDPESRALLLSTMVADCRLIETYRPTAVSRLHCPVGALAAEDDPEVTVAEVAGWATVSTGAFDLAVLPGDHFAIVAHQQEVFRLLTKWLQ